MNDNKIIIVMSGHYWGRGKTIQEAKKNAKYIHDQKFIAWLMPSHCKPEECYVDEIGRLYWTRDALLNMGPYYHKYPAPERPVCIKTHHEFKVELGDRC